jgi:hypothetical protein
MQDFEKEKRQAFVVKNDDYAWGLKDATTSQVYVEDWARQEKERFGVPVIGTSLSHKLCKGDKELMKPGPGLSLLNMLFFFKVFLTQNNGEVEIK